MSHFFSFQQALFSEIGLLASFIGTTFIKKKIESCSTGPAYTILVFFLKCRNDSNPLKYNNQRVTSKTMNVTLIT